MRFILVLDFDSSWDWQSVGSEHIGMIELSTAVQILPAVGTSVL